MAFFLSSVNLSDVLAMCFAPRRCGLEQHPFRIGVGEPKDRNCARLRKIVVLAPRRCSPRKGLAYDIRGIASGIPDAGGIMMTRQQAGRGCQDWACDRIARDPLPTALRCSSRGGLVLERFL
jgi:hypothetical protein